MQNSDNQNCQKYKIDKNVGVNKMVKTKQCLRLTMIMLVISFM